MTERYELEDSSGTLLLENGDNYRLDFPIINVNESVDVNESSNFIKTVIKNIADTLGLTEVVNKFTGFVKIVTEIIVNLEETSVKKLRDNAYLQEGTNDAFLLEDGTGIYIIDYLVKVTNENVGIIEASERVKGLTQIISDIVGLTDALFSQVVKGFVKIVTEVIVNLEEASNKLITNVNVYFLEDGTGHYLTEDSTGFYELDQLLLIKNATTDNVGLTEAVNKMNGILQNITELVSIRLEELSNRLQSMVINVTTETIGLVEAVGRGIRLNVTLETIGLTESSNRLGTIIRNIADIVGFTEASQFVRALTKNITLETIGLTDARNIVTGIVKEAVDTIGLTELSNRIRVVFVSNNLGNFIAMAAITIGNFFSTSTKNVDDMTVVDSYNSGDFKITDDD